MDRVKNFSCSHCSVDFEIKVESGLSDEEVEKETPDSLEWLNGELSCPGCGEEIEEA